MTQDELKKQVAQAALPYLKNIPIIGMGTGSTVTHLIDLLADCDFKHDIEGAVSSSVKTTEHLKKIGIQVLDLNQTGDLDVYVDGADEVTPHKKMLKGGGGALTGKNYCRCQQKICLYRRRKQMRGRYGQIPATGRSVTAGSQLCGTGTGEIGRPTGVTRQLHYRQCLRDSGCAQPKHPGPHCLGKNHQQHPRCRNSRPVRDPWRGCGAGWKRQRSNHAVKPCFASFGNSRGKHAATS